MPALQKNQPKPLTRFVFPAITLQRDHHILAYVTGVIGLFGVFLFIAAALKFPWAIAKIDSRKDLWALSGLLLALCGTLWIACGVLLTKKEYLGLTGKTSQGRKVATLIDAVTAAAHSVLIGVLYLLGGTAVQIVPLFWERWGMGGG